MSVSGGAYTRMVKEMDAENERLLALVREILCAFTERGHPGRSCIRTGWVHEEVYQRWMAAATDPLSSDGSSDV